MTSNFSVKSATKSPFLYVESFDVLDDVRDCPSFSGTGIDACLAEIQQHFSLSLKRTDRAVLSKAQIRGLSPADHAALSRSDHRAAMTYDRVRFINCNRLGHSAVGNRMHTIREILACQFWMDLHRRSLLRETVGEAPLRVKAKRFGPHGPYRLVDIWRIVGTGEDRLARLRHQEQLSLARLASAKRRVRRVLDDWDEAQDLVDIADRDFRQSGPAFERYRHAQCDNYTAKLVAVFGPTPTPEDAATACRILVNIEQATLAALHFRQSAFALRSAQTG